MKDDGPIIKDDPTKLKLRSLLIADESRNRRAASQHSVR
jgi:hypothetical protein